MPFYIWCDKNEYSWWPSVGLGNIIFGENWSQAGQLSNQ